MKSVDVYFTPSASSQTRVTPSSFNTVTVRYHPSTAPSASLLSVSNSDDPCADVSSYVSTVTSAPAPTISIDPSAQRTRDGGLSDGIVHVKFEETKGALSKLHHTDVEALRKRVEAIVSAHNEPLRASRLANDNNAFLDILKKIGSAIVPSHNFKHSTITGIPSDISKTAQLYFGDAKPDKDDIGAYMRGIVVPVVLPMGLLVRYLLMSGETEAEVSNV